MSNQNRIVEQLKKRGELGISKEQAFKYADEISKLTPDQFNKLYEISWRNGCYGTTCYKFLREVTKKC